MANSKVKRLSKNTLKDDLDAYAALQAITGYNPSNTAFSLANVTAAYEAMQERQTLEVQAQNKADAARDSATEGEWDFHDVILGVKAQVKAQFGENSDQLQSLGLKKKSEYKKPSKTPEPTPPTP